MSLLAQRVESASMLGADPFAKIKGLIQEMIAKLAEEIATLEEELGAIAKAQKEADAIRTEEKAAWEAAKADYESGIEGVGMALKVLRDYYAEKEEALIQAKHDKATGAATGIIGMLEVVESDFTKSLAEGTAKEV